MRKALSLLSTAAVMSGPVCAQEAVQPVVKLVRVSDRDDPGMIRSTSPVGDATSWVSAADYPPDALGAGRSGSVFFEIEVGKDDHIAACEVMPLGDSKSSFAEVACDIVRKRGRFLHALDGEGEAQAGRIQMHMRFMLVPASGRAMLPPPPPSAGFGNTLATIKNPELLKLPADPTKFKEPSPTAWLDIDDRGNVKACRIRTSTGTDVGDLAVCQQLKRARFKPARNRTGKEVASPAQFIKLEITP